MTDRLTRKPIAIAADHRGVALKARLTAWLETEGYAVKDCGTGSAAERVDAMDYAVALVTEIKQGRSDFAVGICGSGQMMAIAANRFPFIRATLLHTVEEAASARQHGDANLLALGADTLDGTTAEQMLRLFLTTPALGDRYAERRERLARLDPSAL
ncbi:RpiB/LacA/LacB family sugar-phosphate isomerase [Caulobacter sp. NIBR1757]|uniref:RpiB/LacA/LacB family sugar-phosphate isomerase n=1 Tax=Caulobacter sp. NIBR1757 TaxID=3016000 RepID=UPI0022F13410|nr:RpiB/LacA/LacB family sugar-phosphate isomerase [Caulobacter sp. NIBR1757]WGM38425.1 Putative sugar phosphate isomerase YwlF [Caulobacter sp. NIBR1757]